MAGKKKRREKPEKLPNEVLAESFMAALRKQDDYILTFETDETGNRLLHVMTGKLITPCMLGTLSNRCEMPENQDSRHIILKQG